MRETASGRRQAPLNVTSSLDAERELGIRDAQASRNRRCRAGQHGAQADACALHPVPVERTLQRAQSGSASASRFLRAVVADLKS